MGQNSSHFLLPHDQRPPRCPKGNGTEKFGDICNPGGGFALGKNAEEYDWPGEIPVTEWVAGSEQEVEKRSFLLSGDKLGLVRVLALKDLQFFTKVIWHVDANHAGGYSYRLCKISHESIQHVTEECFQAKIFTIYCGMNHIEP